MTMGGRRTERYCRRERTRLRSVQPLSFRLHAYPDDRRHAAGDSVVPAVREELVGVAVGAAVGEVDAVVGDARREQLQADGPAEVDQALAGGPAHHRRDRTENTIEFRQHLWPDLERLSADAR